jgi:hypothetical protein
VYSSALQIVISRLLDKNPANRPNATEIILLIPKFPATKQTLTPLKSEAGSRLIYETYTSDRPLHRKQITSDVSKSDLTQIT